MTGVRRHTPWIVALALVAACGGGGGGSRASQLVTIHGSGVIADESRAVSGFTSLTYFTEGALHVEQAVAPPSSVLFAAVVDPADGSLQIEELALLAGSAPQESLLVRAEDNLLPYLVTGVQGGVLQLSTAPGVDLQPTLPIEFFLTVTTLESVAFRGVGSIDVQDLTTSALTLTCTGVGTVDLSGLDATDLDVVFTGVGEVRASGNVDRQVVRIFGTGPYSAGGLQSREADVLVQSLDSATVRVSELLIATVRSSGSVYYIGSPTVEATITGTGTVEQIGE